MTLRGSASDDDIIVGSTLVSNHRVVSVAGVEMNISQDLEVLDVRGEGGDDTIDASEWAGIVALRGDTGNDNLISGVGNDSLFGGDGNDTLLGGGGHDSLLGNSGNDTMHGNAGEDTLTGGAGNDKMYGESGADHFYAEDGYIDTIDGGTGAVYEQDYLHSADSLDSAANIEVL